MQQLNDKVDNSGGAQGSLPADEWNQVPGELQNVITQTGQTLTHTDTNQLGKGVAMYAAAGAFFVDGGIANAYSLTAIGGRQAPVAYVDGMTVTFLPGNTNTGAATVNIAGVGVKGIRLRGAALVGGEIPAAAEVTLSYSATNDWFDLIQKDASAETLAALQARTPTAGEVVYLKGRTAAGDGGAGTFQWDSSNLSAAVSLDVLKGIYVPPNSDTTGASGAWVRKNSEVVHVSWFGPNGSTDDLAINAALVMGSTVVEFEPGRTYVLNSDVKFFAGQLLKGNGCTITAGAEIMFMFRNNDIDQPNYGGGSNIIIEGFIFDGQTTSADLGLLGIAHTDNALIRNCVFKNLNSSTGKHCIDASGNANLTVENNVFMDITGTGSTLQIDAATAGSMPTYTAPFLETASATRSQDIRVIGNRFIRCGSATSPYQAVHLHKKGHKRIVISGNQFIDCWAAIFDDLGSTYRANGATTDIVIEGNTIDSSADATLLGGGIALDFVKRATVANNSIRGYGLGVAVLNYAVPVNISNITNANPGVVTTSTPHGFSNGNIIFIFAAGGISGFTSRYVKAANVTATTFELTEPSDGSNIDTTASGAYTSGGTAAYKQFSSSFTNADVSIVNNKINATNRDGVAIDNGVNIVVSGNEITEFGEDDLYRSGIRSDKCVNIKVTKNTVRSTTSGTKFSSSYYRSQKYAIKDNYLASGNYGIYVDKLDVTVADFGTISGNHIDLGTVYMCYLKGNVTNLIKSVAVTGNTFYGEFSGQCLRIEYGEMLTVTGNTMDSVKATGSGIICAYVKNSSISNNAIKAVALSTGSGIDIFGSGYGACSVSANYIELFALGIRVNNALGADNGTIVANTLRGNTTAITAPAGVQQSANDVI